MVKNHSRGFDNEGTRCFISDWFWGGASPGPRLGLGYRKGAGIVSGLIRNQVLAYPTKNKNNSPTPIELIHIYEAQGTRCGASVKATDAGATIHHISSVVQTAKFDCEDKMSITPFVNEVATLRAADLSRGCLHNPPTDPPQS